MRKKQTKKTKNQPKKTRKRKEPVFSFGNINPQHGRILLLIVAIIFVSTILIVMQVLQAKSENIVPVEIAPARRNAAFEKEINKLVQGYPIEKMTPYIANQDPKVAAFLVAIAKKESGWGMHKPVLNGEDCFNYWGFRLKSDRMGSGGHTCFDSPKQAVEAVAQRIDQMVNGENIDSAKEMIVWKCGYGCKDKPKTVDETKWIRDVNLYYNSLTQNL